MDQTSLVLWSWVRRGRTIALCRIDEVRAEPSGDDTVTRLRLAVLETLWGPKAPAQLEAGFTQATSPEARLKSKLPVWGGVEVSKGGLLLYVLNQGKEEAAFHTTTDDPALKAVREVLAHEREAPEARVARYRKWLREGALVQRLFAGEALARDPLPGVDEKGEVAGEAAAIVGDAKADLFLRISAIGWLQAHLWKRTDAKGRAAAVRAFARALSAKEQNLRRFSLDAALDLDGVQLVRQGLVDEEAADLFEAAAAGLAEAQRLRLQSLAKSLRKPPPPPDAAEPR